MNFSFIKIFNPKCAIHAGLSVDGDIYHYILIAKDEGKKAVILFKRTGQFAEFKQFFACPMHVNLQNTAALLVHDSLAGTDPEEWIDCNEERIIPKGLSSKEVINEWCVYEDEIYSGTVLKTSLNEALVKLRAGDFMLSSVSIPLWDLAILYGQHIQGFFIIWNIFSKHSIIGYVEKGRLSSVCNFWAGADDVSSTPDEVKEQLLQLARSLSGFE
ncbi:MAG TPA: hypothetical protein DCO75_12950, partial [Fibrobacteres bacterium]|nr:hypothetical protein [Fibrobacterota bacterium]